MSSPARAEYEARIGGGLRYDDNVFKRAPGNDVTSRGFSRSDIVYTPQAELSLTATPADFDTKLDLLGGYDVYNRNTQLNNFHYLAQLSAKRDTGTFGVDVTGQLSRRLSSFGDILQRIKNTQSFEQVAANLSYAITSDIRIVATPQYSQSNSSNALVKSNDFRQYGSGIGLGYYSPTGNSIAITLSRLETKGLNDRRIFVGGTSVDSPIDQVDNSVDLLLTYRPSELTRLMGQISYVKRNDRSALDVDYSGPSGFLALEYTPRASWSVRIEGGRRLSAQSYLFATAVRTDYAELNWNITVLDRTLIQLGGRYSHRRLQYDPLLSTQQSRTDKTTTLFGTVTQPIGRRLIAELQAGHEFRDSTALNRNYRSTYVMGSLLFRIGSKP